jgi:hypothetical protein
LIANAKKTAKGISERKCKEVRRAISAKDIEWQARFEELAEQVAKLSKAGCQDTESIVEVKLRIASCPCTALPVRAKGAEATLPALLLSPPTAGHYVRDPSQSPLPENNKEEERHSTPPQCRSHYALEYLDNNRPELEVRESQRHTRPSDSKIVLVK